jgi:CheY-like chemotaxis protein
VAEDDHPRSRTTEEGNDMPIARILVVDDDPILLQMVRAFLEVADFVVFEAVDGPDALVQAAAVRPDLILLDLMMPGMDGYTVCRTLQAEPTTQAIPVIFLTASSDPGLNRQAYAAGAMACLTKPFRREALLAVVQTALQGAARRKPRTGG